MKTTKNKTYVLFGLLDGAYERRKSYLSRDAAVKAAATCSGCVREYMGGGWRWIVPPATPVYQVWLTGPDGLHRGSSITSV